MNTSPKSTRPLVALLVCAGCILTASAATTPAASTTTPAVTPAPTPALPPAELARPTVSIGHTVPITAARISPDGKRLFTSDAANLRAWDVESGKELKLLQAYGGGERGWELASELVFDEAKKMLLVPRHGGVAAFNSETLEELLGWPDGAQAAVWDPKTNKTYYCDTDGTFGTFVFGELDSNRKRWTCVRRAGVQLAVAKKFDAVCRRLILVEGGNLIADTNAGRLFIDTKTWQITHPGQEPERTTKNVMHYDDTFIYPLATFSKALPVEAEIFAGPDRTVLAFAPAKTAAGKSAVTVEVRSGKDLRPLRSAQIETVTLRYNGPQSYDAKTKTLWLRGVNDLYALDFETLGLRETVSMKHLLGDARFDNELQALEPLAPPSQWIVASPAKIWKYDISAKRVTTTLGDNVLAIRHLATSPRGFEFTLSDEKSQVKRVRFLPNGLEVTNAARGVTALAYDPAGETLAQGDVIGGRIQFSDSASWKKIDYQIPTSGNQSYGNANTLTYSDDGRLLLIHGEHGIAVISLETGKTLFEQKLLSVYRLERAQIPSAISPDNRHVIAYDSDRILRGFDLQTGKKIWEQKMVYQAALFFFVGPRTFACLRDGNLQYRAIESGELLAEHDLEKGFNVGRSHALSKDKKLAAICTDSLKIYDTENGKLLFNHKTDTTITSVAFFANPRYLVTASADNLLRLWDTTQKRELCTLALFQNDNEWVVSTPELRFDASEKAVDKMYVVKGGDIIPLESLFEKLYTPKLLASLLAGEKLEPPAVDLQKLRTPPTVKIAFATGTRNLTVEDDTAGNEVDLEAVKLNASAEARDSSISEIRLFQNGKLLTVAVGNGTRFTQSFDAKLTPGENVFRAIAFNADRTESRPSEVVVTYRPKGAIASVAGAAPEKSAGGGLQLHLLIVGVNTYKNPKYNLNYAVADATAVKEKLEAQTKSIFTAVNVMFILNEKADKASLTAAFKTISAKAGPRDVFVFYYAGHGVMTSDAKPDFFLVPHDVLQLYGADDALRQKGISSTELMELSKIMPAQKQLFILDACQSAGALTTVAMRGAAEEKAIAQLARSTGTHWLTASGSEQFATEFAELGHGVFTYALIEGLSGKADTGDGRVTVNELKAWLETQVPELTQKHKGTPQYPSSYGFGQDFPVAVIAK